MSESLTVESRKAQWEEKTLGEICDFVNGYAFKSKDFRDSGVPVIRISNIKNNRISKNKLVFVDNENLESLRAFTSSKGDILIAMSGATTGKIGINDLDECSLLNQRVGKFIPKVGLSKNYLYYFLNIFSSHFLNISEGSAQPNLSTKQIKETLINIPPLEEQKRIVDVLDKAFETIDKAIANTEANLASTKELFQSVLNDTFDNIGDDWEEKALEEVCEIKGRIGYRGYTKNDLVTKGNGAISLSPANIVNQEIVFNKNTYIRWQKYYESPEIMVQEKDLVFCKTGSTLGKCAFINFLPEKITLNPQLVVLKKISENPKYLYYTMINPSFQNQIHQKKGGSAAPTISQKILNGCLIPIANKEEQNRIVDVLDSLSTKTKQLEAVYESKLASLKELKQSLLQKAFAGDL